MSSQLSTNIRSDYGIALLCNACTYVRNRFHIRFTRPLIFCLFSRPDSTNNEYFMRPLQVLLETIHGNQKSQTPMPGNCMAAGPTQPLSVEILDSLTVHAKMSLIHGIVSNIIKLAQAKSNLALAPALVETYSRLLVYTEIESLGVKGFIGKSKRSWLRPSFGDWKLYSPQVSCCRPCSKATRMASCTRCSRCSATACTTYSHTTGFSCSAICTAWRPSRRPTRPSSIYGAFLTSHLF